MTNADITGLLAQLESQQTKVSTILDMVDSGFSSELIRAALEELHSKAESLKYGFSAYEEPYLKENGLSSLN